MIIAVPQLIAGAALLVLGRRLFWLFVATVGFLTGITLAPRIFPAQSETVILIIAIGLGIIGAILAVMFQRFAVALAGFVLGGWVGLAVLRTFGLAGTGLPSWFFFLAGGIIGAILIAALFDWALIILSSLAGAGFIVDSLFGAPQATTLVRVPTVPGAPLALVLFVVLFVAGLVIQGRQLRRG